jgi:hypothetical protein
VRALGDGSSGSSTSRCSVGQIVDCGDPPTIAQAVLEMLAQAGLIERWEDTRGTITYVARK